MLLKQARMVHWKNWEAKNECEELNRFNVAGPTYNAAKEDKQSAYTQTPTCDDETGCGRRGPEKILRHWLPERLGKWEQRAAKP